MNRSLQKGKQRFGWESLMDRATHTRFSTNASDAKEHFFHFVYWDAEKLGWMSCHSPRATSFDSGQTYRMESECR
ncbi:hypothetical protein TNCV_678681 [Trichonephila clavipes]|nr:hypothetical protein TNCV_678681 [Trichonephila clavipes]